MLLESKFQAKLIKDIKRQFPGAIVLKTDPSHIQGIPDLFALYGQSWAALETKRSKEARHGNNQDYWVAHCDDMSYGTFVYPENIKEVMRELQQALQFNR